MTVCFLKASPKGTDRIILQIQRWGRGLRQVPPKNARTEEDLMLRCKRYRLYQLVSYQSSILNFNDFNRQ